MKFPSKIAVAVLTSEHMFEICEQNNSDVKLSGVEGKFLDIIASALKFKYQVKTPAHRDWGHLDTDGHWTGLVGMVHRKEADIALSTLTMSDDRMTVVDFTTPYTIQDVTFILQKPETLFNTNDIFQPFDLNSWICILLVLIIYTLIFCYLLRPYSYVNIFLDLFGSLLRQPGVISNKTMKSNFLFALWWFFTFVVSYCYSSILLSYMTLPMHQKSIRTFKELSDAVKKGSYKCLVEKGSTVSKSLSMDNVDYLRYLGESIEKNEWFFFTSDIASGNVRMKNTAILNVRFKLEMINSLLSTSGPMEISDDVYVSWKLAIAIRKDFCCKRKLNTVISRVWNAGLFNKLKSDEWFRMSSEMNGTLDVQKVSHQLTVADIYSSILILCIGYVLSLFVCFGEMINFYLRRNYLFDN